MIYGQRTADGRIAFGGRGAPYHFGSAVRPGFDVEPEVHALLRRTLDRDVPRPRGRTLHPRVGGAGRGPARLARLGGIGSRQWARLGRRLRRRRGGHDQPGRTDAGRSHPRRGHRTRPRCPGSDTGHRTGNPSPCAGSGSTPGCGRRSWPIAAKAGREGQAGRRPSWSAGPATEQPAAARVRGRWPSHRIEVGSTLTRPWQRLRTMPRMWPCCTTRKPVRPSTWSSTASTSSRSRALGPPPGHLRHVGRRQRAGRVLHLRRHPDDVRADVRPGPLRHRPGQPLLSSCSGCARLQGPNTGTTVFAINRAPFGPNGSRPISFFNWITQIGFEVEGLILIVGAGLVLMAKAGFVPGRPSQGGRSSSSPWSSRASSRSSGTPPSSRRSPARDPLRGPLRGHARLRHPPRQPPRRQDERLTGRRSWRRWRSPSR